MNLQQLRYAVEVDKHKSITKAARSLFVSQPAVSTAIRELEAELKIQIFARTPTGVETTGIGMAFISDALDILKKTETLGRRYSQHQGEAVYTLRVAGPPADSSLRALISAVNNYRRDGVDFKLSYLNQLVFDVVDSVEKGSVDIGIISYKNYFSQIIATILEQKDLEFRLISEYPLCLAVSCNHPLASVNRVRYEDLLKYPFVSADSDFHDSTLQAIALALGAKPSENIPPLKTVQVVDMYSVIKLMKDASAVGAITAWSFADEATRDSGIVRLLGTLGDMTEIRGWIKRKDSALSPRASEFIGYIHSYFSEYVVNTKPED